MAWRQGEAGRHLRQARQALADCDFERARSHLNDYLAGRPDDAEGQFLLAQVGRRAREEDYPQARQHLEAARRLGWSRLDTALEGVMLDFQEHGAAGDSEAALRRYLESGGQSERLVLEALARGCLRDNRLDEATAFLHTWVRRYPDDWYAHFWRGAVLEYLAKPNLAIPDYRFVLEKRPGDEEVRLRLGLMLAQSGYDFDEALGHLESYRRGRPDDPDALVGIAFCRRQLQQPEAAEGLLRQVVAAHPDHAEALLNLALLDMDRGNDKEALGWLLRLEPLARQPREAEELERLCRLVPVPNHADHSHNVRTVLVLLAKVYARLGQDAEARRCQAEAEQVAADYDEMRKTLSAVRARPDDMDLLRKLGTLYLRLGLADNGVACLERVLQKRPADPLAQRTLAEYHAGRKPGKDKETRRPVE
jgi:tetratricopeptide (TPR) repeat protein